MAGSRILIAALVMLAIGVIVRARLRLTRNELVVLSISGLLLWVGGNGLVTWAEQRAHSGYAALLVGSMPIWIAVHGGGYRPEAAVAGAGRSLVVGFAGLALLVGPVLATVLARMWSR